jgi:GABA(A) receptor-associated protein
MFQKNWHKLPAASKRKEYEKIHAEFPHHIPVIVFAPDDLNLNKHKFLIQQDMTVGQFMYILRGRINLNENDAIFLFVNNTMVSVSQLISIVYKEYKNESGFVYLHLQKEATFG